MCGITDLNIQNRKIGDGVLSHLHWVTLTAPDMGAVMGNTQQTRVKKGHSRESESSREISEDIREEADEALLKLFKNLGLFSSCVCVDLTLKSQWGTEKPTPGEITAHAKIGH